MAATFLLEAPIGLAPVIVFLIVLLRLDSFRLVSFRAVLLTVAGGAALAIASYPINGALFDVVGTDIASYTRYVAPVIEEALKASVIVYFFRRNHIGFMIDAAILGFAVGAGFALVENVYYLYAFPDANFGVWIIRGFGTAVMHGGATALFGVISQSLTERHARTNALLYAPGLAAAVVLHSVFNHFPGSPLIATLAMLIAVPVALVLVFAKSRHKIHDWLTTDYETHAHLLEAIRSGDFAHSEGGRFITDLAAKFDAAHVADIFDYVRLHTELVLEAERVLLARERGEAVALAGDAARFAALHALERRIGHTALLAIWPHLHFSRQELAELYELEARVKHAKAS